MKDAKNDQEKNFEKHVAKEIVLPIGIEEKYAYMISKFFSLGNDKLGGGSLSSAVYFNSLEVAFKSIINKPLGWGINGYENAFKFYKSKSLNEIHIQNHNIKDASNNFAKITVEFGIFGILFYFMLIVINLSKKLPIEYKLIYLPIIITQSIRGAGYFNSGFILIVFLLLFSYINFTKKN